MKQRKVGLRTDYGQPSDKTTDYGQHPPIGGYLSVLTTDSHGQNYGQENRNPGGPSSGTVAEDSSVRSPSPGIRSAPLGWCNSGRSKMPSNVEFSRPLGAKGGSYRVAMCFGTSMLAKVNLSRLRNGQYSPTSWILGGEILPKR